MTSFPWVNSISNGVSGIAELDTKIYITRHLVWVRAKASLFAAAAVCYITIDHEKAAALPQVHVIAHVQIPSSQHLLNLIPGIIFGVQPLGSVLSGYLSEVLGRKRSMMLVAVPQLIGWLLMYFSQDLLMIYISGFMMGFSIGFMEAPSLSYVGEICQPHLRANMCSLTSLNVPLGYLVMYLLGTILDWRTTALCSAAMPILTVLAITLSDNLLFGSKLKRSSVGAAPLAPMFLQEDFMY
ncbi:hypothetical protein J6590_043061 [Homalodisca vitripennis]|nr:hypothetical protein J6590_043061 [Homalodisca vitripennis]